ncbi:hypothetical protein ACE14D_02030 [Streptomyces sp. Act-28]
MRSVEGAIGECASPTTVQDGERTSIASEGLTAPRVGDASLDVRLVADAVS